MYLMNCAVSSSSKAARMHPLAIAEDRDAVAHGTQFIQTVGDVNHARTALAQFANNAENFFRLGLRERRRRLVERSGGRNRLNGAADLDQLLLRRAELLNDPVRL